MSQQVQVPTLEQLQAQLTQLIVQRSTAKDQVEQFDKQLPVLNALVQVLTAQAEEARTAAEAEVTPA